MNDYLDLAKKLITVPSITGNKTELLTVLSIAQDALGEKYPTEEFESNSVPSLLIRNTEEKPSLYKVILNAHLDVVPGTPEQYNPFEKDGRLYGRGAHDMKAGSAVIILVFKEVAKKVNYPLALQLVTDEETNGHYGTRYQIEKGIRAHFVLAGESTNLDINTKSKGVFWAVVTASGQTAHGARLWNGKNAIWTIHEFLEKLKQEFPVPDKEVWQTTINVSSIETNNKTYNKVPQDCTVKLDIRYIPEEKDTIEGKIHSMLPKNCALKILHKDPSHLSSKDNKFITALQDATEFIRGSAPKFIDKPGTSDVRFYTENGGEGITFGPIGAGLHSDDEWVDIQSLEHYYKILKNFLLLLNEK